MPVTINALIKIANELDKRGLVTEADGLDKIISSIDEEMYHGSNVEVNELVPKKHFLSDEPVVFGTPSKAMALAHLARWTDDDFELGSINEEPLVLKEKYPNAFEEIFRGQKGYIYSVDPEGFESKPNLMRQERVSFESPEILSVEEIDDVLKALEQSDLVLKKYRETNEL